VLPENGGVHSIIRMKEEVAISGIPQEILEFLGPAKTVLQGRWQLSAQFQYRHAYNARERVFASVARFRKAFLVLNFAVADLSTLSDEQRRDFIAPDELLAIPASHQFSRKNPWRHTGAGASPAVQ